MLETWRWFGEFDPITLPQIHQTGAQGIVSALHAIPYGQVWPRAAIAARKAQIEAAGFTWDVVESLPVHEDIKRGSGDLERLFDAYRESLRNLAAEGLTTICYNFMPVLDWTRTDLAAAMPGGGTGLVFSAAKMAAFEIHMLGRKAAVDTYSDAAVAAAARWWDTSTPQDQARLLEAIMAGLPGAVETYDLDGLRSVLQSYAGITHQDLRANLKRFLQEVIPTATSLGVHLCIHPDDPPRDILGLPRIVSTQQDVAWIMEAVDAPANGLTLCTGSFGAHPANDVPAMANAFGDRVHFVHLRNVKKSADGSFAESGHLVGDVDMVAVIDELLEAESQSGRNLPFRADHGHALLDDCGRDVQPGYTLIGRLRGLAELRGVIASLS